MAYVKPHGALYNDMMADPLKLRTVLEAVAAYDSNLPLMLMATADNRAAQALGDEIGVPLWFEAFADRAYTASGHLLSRRLPGAVHHDPARVVEQAVRLARGETLLADDGSALQLAARTSACMATTTVRWRRCGRFARPSMGWRCDEAAN